MLRMRAWGALAMALMVTGCLGQMQISGESTTLTAPAGVKLPLPARAMLYMAPGDLDRPLVIEATLYRNEETTFKDGRALERAAKDTLSQAFAQVETNSTALRPHLVVKVIGVPKFSRRDNLLKVGCGFDVYQADGAMLGSFIARFDPKAAVEYRDAVEPSYRVCLRKAADQMLASPAVIRAAQSNAEPNAAAYKSFVESLGLRP
jgi:hypothetical protein